MQWVANPTSLARQTLSIPQLLVLYTESDQYCGVERSGQPHQQQKTGLGNTQCKDKSSQKLSTESDMSAAYEPGMGADLGYGSNSWTNWTLQEINTESW